MKTIKFLKPYYIPVLIIFVLIYIQVVYSDLALPDYMSKIINNGIINGSTNYILKTGGKMILVSFLGIVTSISAGFLASRVGAKLARDLRLKVYDKVINFDHTSIKKFGVSSHLKKTENHKSFFKEYMYGKAYFINMVDKELGQKILCELDTILWEY